MAIKGQNLNLTAKVPYRLKQFRIPLEQEQAVTTQIKDLLKQARKEIREKHAK